MKPPKYKARPVATLLRILACILIGVEGGILAAKFPNAEFIGMIVPGLICFVLAAYIDHHGRKAWRQERMVQAMEHR